MLSSATCPKRLSVAGLAGAIACLFLILIFFSRSFATSSLEYIHASQDKIGSVFGSHTPSAQVYNNCQDPYRRPGYLYIDKDNYKDSRWIPYSSDFLDADIPDYAQYPVPAGQDVFFNVTKVESAILDSTSVPPQWMPSAVTEGQRRRKAVSTGKTVEDFVGMKDDGDLGWLWGRRLLIFGDSVDRFMIQFFCEEFGWAMQQQGSHTTATCEVPTLNLTLIHWHFAGSWTSRPDWWWMDDMKEIPFEERWPKLWAPLLDTHVRGLNGMPDLVFWNNGLWDQRALWEAAEAHHKPDTILGQRERQLAWQELRFVGARIQKLVQRIHDEFPGVPTMFRANTVHRDSSARDASTLELDRLSRAIAERAGHEVFEWGRLVAAFSMLYKDNTHIDKGAGSWLWGDMVLESLARAAHVGDRARAPYFDGWDACHSRLVAWGGR